MNDLPERATFTKEDRRFVYEIARRIVRDDDAAADVTQDAMLLAYRHRGRFRGDSRYRTWLYRIASSSAITYLRRNRRRWNGVTQGFDDIPEPCTEAASPEDQAADSQAAVRAHVELEALDERYRDVLRLRFVDEMSEAEVARKLGVSIATVKTRTFRGRHALRASLAA